MNFEECENESFKKIQVDITRVKVICSCGAVMDYDLNYDFYRNTFICPACKAESQDYEDIELEEE